MSNVPTKSGSFSLSDPRLRSIIFQLLLLVALVSFFVYIGSNTITGLKERNLASGFGFLEKNSGFEISEALLEYNSSKDTYFKAYLIGILNTLKVAIVGIFFATIIGVLLGVARLSSNWLVSKLSMCWVEFVRNVPLLLQLFFWYALFTNFPGPREAYEPVSNFFISSRGFQYPFPQEDLGWTLALIGVAVGLVIAFIVSVISKKRQNKTGRRLPVLWINLAVIFAIPVLLWIAGGAPTEFDIPNKTRFNIQGGATVTPEYMALLLGLVVYTAGFIAEIVRSGIMAVPPGQNEAAGALGLRNGLVLRLIVLPQALRIIIPPTTSQYLNLTKNSSLAVAIGYADLVSIGNTIISQTGQAIEAIAMMMLVYLTISIAISIFMNWYNSHIALVER